MNEFEGWIVAARPYLDKSIGMDGEAVVFLTRESAEDAAVIAKHSYDCGDYRVFRVVVKVEEDSVE